MITGRQIRAARALLGWDAADLAEKAHISRETISNIENGATKAREHTLREIERVFNNSGLEFIDNQGVRFKPQGVEVLVGRDGLCKFFDGVYEYTKENGGKIVQLGMDETFFTNILGDYSHIQKKRMAELVKKRDDVEVQSLICEGDMNFFASEYNEYRWLSKDIFELVPFYIYGENLGIMTFQTTPSPTIILHKFPAITNAYRKQFEAMWRTAQIPDPSKKQGGENASP